MLECTPITVKISETGNTLPGRYEASLPATTPCRQQLQLASNSVTALSPCLAILFTQLLVVTSFAKHNRFGPADMSDGAVGEHNS